MTIIEEDRHIDWELIEDIMEDTGCTLDDILNAGDPRMDMRDDWYGED